MEVRHCLARAHYALRIEAARRGPDAMLVSTIVVLLVRDDYYACLWAGDSRAYLLRGERFRQLTRDHSLVQELFDAGAISAAEILHHPSANIITRAIGAEGLELDKVTDRLFSGDRFLLCSDGLFKTLPERELARVLGAESTWLPNASSAPPSNSTPTTMSPSWQSKRPGRRIGVTSRVGSSRLQKTKR